MIDQIHSAGGTEKHLAYLVKSLDKKKFNTSIVIFDLKPNPLVDEIRNAGIPVIHIPVEREYSFNAFQKTFHIKKIIKEKKIRIIQTFHFKSDVYGALIARLSGVKHIISSKRDVGYSKKWYHFQCNRIIKGIVERYIVVSDMVGNVIIKKEKVPHKKIEKIYNGVEINKFQVTDYQEKIKAKKRLGLEESDFVVGSVAWFRPEKDHDTLLKAFIEASKEIQHLKLVLVGGGPLLGYYKNFVKKKGINDDVVLAGSVKDVSLYLDSFDIACLVPKGNEGFSNSILEKMAKGLPLIVTDVGGNKEAVLDGHNGYVIEPCDYSLLKKYIVDLYQHNEKRKKMGYLSRERVEVYFGLDKMVQAHEYLYEKIMQI